MSQTLETVLRQYLSRFNSRVFPTAESIEKFIEKHLDAALKFTESWKEHNVIVEPSPTKRNIRIEFRYLLDDPSDPLEWKNVCELK